MKRRTRSKSKSKNNNNNKNIIKPKKKRKETKTTTITNIVKKTIQKNDKNICKDTPTITSSSTIYKTCFYCKDKPLKFVSGASSKQKLIVHSKRDKHIQATKINNIKSDIKQKVIGCRVCGFDVDETRFIDCKVCHSTFHSYCLKKSKVPKKDAIDTWVCTYCQVYAKKHPDDTEHIMKVKTILHGDLNNNKKLNIVNDGGMKKIVKKIPKTSVTRKF